MRLSEFIPAFFYLLILEEELNLFDIIDCCWWSRTKRTHFADIVDDNDYRGISKHWAAFLRVIPVFACAAIIAAVVISAII